MRIALAGNPNSGKTTMFNALTGRNEQVGNWAGVTVEKKEHTIKKSLTGGREDVIAVDLPGAYSMSPYTSEESVTSVYINNAKPDVIINIVDGTNLRRSLFFTTQLLELGIPVVVALNKTDLNEKKDTKIDTARLSQILGCAVIETVSTSRRGLSRLVECAVSKLGSRQSAPFSYKSLGVGGRGEAKREDRARYTFVNEAVEAVEVRRTAANKKTVHDAVDAILTNRWFGLPIFALVMFVVFWISQVGPGVWIADLFSGWLERGQTLVAEAIGSDGIWASILIDGIIGGVIAVIGFLPLVMVMYFLIALLEDCGYMARATVVLDPIFKKVGLSGKSVIPFVIGTGCAVPGIMACRTIRDERERKATAMLAPFMPCGAKLPVIALFAGVFFGDSAWVGTLMYFMGIVIILIGAVLVNLITGNRKKSFFIIELPEYKLPGLPRALKTMVQRGWAYIVKAGTIILVCNFAVHIMQNFDWSFRVIDEGAADTSILATIALPFAYILAPVVGFVSWQLTAAAITGFIAKENVVGTLAVCFGITNLINVDELVLESGASVSEVALAFGTGSGSAMNTVMALAFLMFNLFSPPCFAALGAMRSEIGERRWFLSGVALQLGVGYSIGFLVYFFGTLFSGGRFLNAWCVILGWVIVVALLALVTMLAMRRTSINKKKTEKKERAIV